MKSISPPRPIQPHHPAVGAITTATRSTSATTRPRATRHHELAIAIAAGAIDSMIVFLQPLRTAALLQRTRHHKSAFALAVQVAAAERTLIPVRRVRTRHPRRAAIAGNRDAMASAPAANQPPEETPA